MAEQKQSAEEQKERELAEQYKREQEKFENRLFTYSSLLMQTFCVGVSQTESPPEEGLLAFSCGVTEIGWSQHLIG